MSAMPRDRTCKRCSLLPSSLRGQAGRREGVLIAGGGEAVAGNHL